MNQIELINWIKELKAQGSAELLAAFLSSGKPTSQTLRIAQRLLDHFHSLSHLFKSPAHLVLQVKGVTFDHLLKLKTAYIIHRVTLREKLLGIPLSPQNSDLQEYCLYTMTNLPQEKLRTFYLDKDDYLIEDELIEVGTHNQCPVNLYDFQKRLLDLKPKGLIFAHNHPSGNPTPSFQDIVLTQKLRKLFFDLGVFLKGHLIVGDKECFVIS